MNKNYVVSYINYFDNELKIYFIKAKTVRWAVLNTVEKDHIKNMEKYLPKDKEKIIEYYFGSDANIAIEEIPEEF